MSRPLKRSFSIKGHRTSISLEAPFWDALRKAAAEHAGRLARLARADDVDDRHEARVVKDREQGGAWLMFTGTSEAHIMVPGR